MCENGSKDSLRIPKQRRFTVFQDITEKLEAEPDLLNSVITGDESKEVEVESNNDAHCVLRYSRHRSFRIPTPRQ